MTCEPLCRCWKPWGSSRFASAAALYWWTPWVVVPAILLIATRQQACFVLAHDAAHYRLFRARWLNDLVGGFVATIVGISMRTYRVVHRLHHNHLYEARDPDIPLHGGYPRGRGYLLKKLAKDLTGLTAYKTYSYFFGAPAINDDAEGTKRPLDDTLAGIAPWRRGAIGGWSSASTSWPHCSPMSAAIFWNISPVVDLTAGHAAAGAPALPGDLRAWRGGGPKLTAKSRQKPISGPRLWVG